MLFHFVVQISVLVISLSRPLQAMTVLFNAMKQISFHSNNLFVAKFSTRAPKMNWLANYFMLMRWLELGIFRVYEISDSHLNLLFASRFKVKYSLINFSSFTLLFIYILSCILHIKDILLNYLMPTICHPLLRVVAVPF